MREIVLAYHDGAFNIKVNDEIIKTEKDLDCAVESFKQAVKNNDVKQSISWETAACHLEGMNNVVLNKAYKTATFNDLRYFYNTGQVFYIQDGQMKTLVGGFDTFKNLVALINNGAAAYEKSLIELCIYVGGRQGTYNLDQNSLYIGYGAFSYGKVGYDFNAHKMDKGTSKEQATFDEFKTYVMNVIR